MSFQTLITKIENGILIVTINRPDKLNALNQLVLKELREVFDNEVKDISVRAIIITGSGEKAFVAGADIAEFTEINSQESVLLCQKTNALFAMIERCSKPVVAAINGFALGGGLELAMACHIRIASDNALMGLPETTLGLIPGYGGTQRLPQIIGKGRALEMILTAKKIDAQTALNWGLVNEVVALSQLIEYTQKWLLQVIEKAPIAIEEVIQNVQRAVESTGPDYINESRSFGRCVTTNDFKEGVSAFLNKRKATFKGN
jgi:enoyl-CoA hydratase